MRPTARMLLGTAVVVAAAFTGISQESRRTIDVIASLEVPEQVGVQADGEFTFDLSRLPAGKEGAEPCVDRFPPPFECAVTFFRPTSTLYRSRTAHSLGGGTVFLQVVDNLPFGTVHVRHSISVEWSGGEPGIPTTAIETAAVDAWGEVGDFRPLPTAPEEILAFRAPTGPVRGDRAIRLALPKGARIGSTPQPVTATITYDVFHTPS